MSPMPAPARIGLPGHIPPVEGEALLSWVAALSAVLGMTPRVFCRDALGIDVRQHPAWWRRPDPSVMARIRGLTGIDHNRLAAMTLDGWAIAPGDDDAGRFAAKRWTGRQSGKAWPGRVDVCPLCLTEAPRPELPLIWMLGWAGACPHHGTALTGMCPACGKVLRLRGLNASEPIDLLCGRCNAPLSDAGTVPAHSAMLDLQAALVAGQRSGTVVLPGIGTLDWPTTMALCDVLLAMVWARRTKKQRDYLAPRRRDRLFAGICRDLGLIGSECERIPWTENYGGLLLLAWLMEDLDQRLPKAVATLLSPRLERLLAPFLGLDDAMKDRLREILAKANIKQGENRRAWKLWLDSLNAAQLREQSVRDRYKHRRQRLRALAELRDGVPIEAVAALIGFKPRSIYRWLHQGATGGLEAALERPTGKPALTGTQAEAMGQWIAAEFVHQNRRAIIQRAREAFGIDLNPDAASKLLAKHRRSMPARPHRLWGPRRSRRKRAGSNHDPAPDP